MRLLFYLACLLSFSGCSNHSASKKPALSLNELIELSDKDLNSFNSWVEKRGYNFDTKKDILADDEPVTSYTYLYPKNIHDSSDTYYAITKNIGKMRTVSDLIFETDQENNSKLIFDELSKSFSGERVMETKGGINAVVFRDKGFKVSLGSVSNLYNKIYLIRIQRELIDTIK